LALGGASTSTVLYAEKGFMLAGRLQSSRLSNPVQKGSSG
jgi:hypothetical protein